MVGVAGKRVKFENTVCAKVEGKILALGPVNTRGPSFRGYCYFKAAGGNRGRRRNGLEGHLDDLGSRREVERLGVILVPVGFHGDGMPGVAVKAGKRGFLSLGRQGGNLTVLINTGSGSQIGRFYVELNTSIRCGCNRGYPDDEKAHENYRDENKPY
jgi:hypothetical protein